jgi:hypothetical protein
MGDGLVYATLCYTGYDHLLYILDGSENQLACSTPDPNCSYGEGIIDFLVEQGVTYYIVIDGMPEAGRGECGDYEFKFRYHSQQIGKAGVKGPGGAGGPGNRGGGNGLAGSSWPDGWWGEPGFYGDPGDPGGQGGSGTVSLTDIDFSAAGTIQLGGFAGDAGSRGTDGCDGGNGGNGGGILTNGTPGQEPSPDRWPVQNGGPAGSTPSGHGGNGTNGGGGGGGGGSAPFFGGGNGGIGADGVDGADGDGGSGATGVAQTVTVTSTGTIIHELTTMQVGGDGGPGGNGGNGGGGGGGGGGAGEYWGTPSGIGAEGGIGGDGGVPGAGGPGGQGTFIVGSGATMRNYGQIHIGNEEGVQGFLKVRQGGELTNRSDGYYNGTITMWPGSEFIVEDAASRFTNLYLVQGDGLLIANLGTLVNCGSIRGAVLNEGLHETSTGCYYLNVIDDYTENGTLAVGLNDYGGCMPVQVDVALTIGPESVLQPFSLSPGYFDEDLMTWGDSWDIVLYPPGVRSGEIDTIDDSRFPLTEGYWVLTYDNPAGDYDAVRLVYSSTPSDVPGHGAPHRTALHQASPNPFNPSTSIRYDLDRTGSVNLTVFDMAGRVVRRLVANEVGTPGRHEIEWNGRDDAGRQAASGTYFYRLEAGGHEETKRMVLVK